MITCVCAPHFWLLTDHKELQVHCAAQQAHLRQVSEASEVQRPVTHRGNSVPLDID